MATKASGILLLIIEKQHASWDLMCSTLPALESVNFDASPTQPPHAPPWARLAHAPAWWFAHV